MGVKHTNKSMREHLAAKGKNGETSGVVFNGELITDPKDLPDDKEIANPTPHPDQAAAAAKASADAKAIADRDAQIAALKAELDAAKKGAK